MAVPVPRETPFAGFVRRVRTEYLQMPGLRLTAPQARRLFGLDDQTLDMVLAALLEAKFLSRALDGRLVMTIA
jgi:hypothetical protein